MNAPYYHLPYELFDVTLIVSGVKNTFAISVYSAQLLAWVSHTKFLSLSVISFIFSTRDTVNIHKLFLSFSFVFTSVHTAMLMLLFSKLI